ncbi:MAG TPA: hypothetical protein VF178_02235, partial [Gemmatimonadaceae bacterium]
RLASGREAAEYARAARMLDERAAALANAGRTPTPAAEAAFRRARFVESALAALRESGSVVERLAVEGPAKTVLVAAGTRSARDLALPFESFASLRLRLEGLGFRSVRVEGADGTRVISLAPSTEPADSAAPPRTPDVSSFLQ